MKSAKKFEMEFTFMVSITAGPSKKRRRANRNDSLTAFPDPTTGIALNRIHVPYFNYSSGVKFAEDKKRVPLRGTPIPC
jgi:hypothetical protein